MEKNVPICFVKQNGKNYVRVPSFQVVDIGGKGLLEVDERNVVGLK